MLFDLLLSTFLLSSTLACAPHTPKPPTPRPPVTPKPGKDCVPLTGAWLKTDCEVFKGPGKCDTFTCTATEYTCSPNFMYAIVQSGTKNTGENYVSITCDRATGQWAYDHFANGMQTQAQFEAFMGPGPYKYACTST